MNAQKKSCLSSWKKLYQRNHIQRRRSVVCGEQRGDYRTCKEIREKFPEKTQWLYTGYEWNQIQNEAIIPYLDVVVDGRFEVEQKDTKLHWKGSANQKVIDVQDSLKTGKIVLHDA